MAVLLLLDFLAWCGATALPAPRSFRTPLPPHRAHPQDRLPLPVAADRDVAASLPGGPGLHGAGSGVILRARPRIPQDGERFQDEPDLVPAVGRGAGHGRHGRLPVRVPEPHQCPEGTLDLSLRGVRRDVQGGVETTRVTVHGSTPSPGDLSGIRPPRPRPAQPDPRSRRPPTPAGAATSRSPAACPGCA